MWQFIVAPHRGIWATGLWSVRLHGTLIGIHACYVDAMHDAVRRAALHWADCAADSQIVVLDGHEPEETGGACASNARPSGRRRAPIAT
jgi:hypothetical protein